LFSRGRLASFSNRLNLGKERKYVVQLAVLRPCTVRGPLATAVPLV